MISQEDLTSKKDSVLNIQFPSKLDQGLEDLENVVFTERGSDENFVFDQVIYSREKNIGAPT